MWTNRLQGPGTAVVQLSFLQKVAERYGSPAALKGLVRKAVEKPEPSAATERIDVDLPDRVDERSVTLEVPHFDIVSVPSLEDELSNDAGDSAAPVRAAESVVHNRVV